jgi:hypothetical protein
VSGVVGHEGRYAFYHRTSLVKFLFFYSSCLRFGRFAGRSS